MAISIPKRKSKKSKTVEVDEQSFPESFLYRLFSKLPVLLLFLFIIFIWSFSTTIISGSIVHICVTSRKLNDLYCLSAGAHPANYSIPLPEIRKSSKLSVVREDTHQAPSISTKSTSNNVTESSLISSPSVAYHNPPVVETKKAGVVNLTPQQSPSTSTKPILNVALENRASSLQSSSNLDGSSKSPTSTAQKDAKDIPSIPASVLKDSVDIKLPVSENNSTALTDGRNKQMGDSIDTAAPVSSPSTHFSPFIDPILRRASYKGKAEEIANARKDVEGQLVVLRSYIPKSKPLDCDGRGIYVYDLPAKFNKDLLAQCNKLVAWLDFCKYFLNDAMGENIPELGNDWYNTHQYALEPIFHSRVLNHPCRVHNAVDAKLFYVPFYGGLDILRWHFQNVTNDVKDKLSEELIEWLAQQQMWNRHFGMDHVFVFGKISWDFRRTKDGSWGTRFLELDELQNPMKLLIERQPWHINDVGVPHPTYFHPSSDDAILAWQAKIREAQRSNLVSFAGAPRQSSESIRSIIIEQCISATNTTCKFFDCRNRGCTNPAPVIKLFVESEFCLQPPGDSPTRKSVFDSLVAGCIPVLFDPFSAYYQYPWHLPEDHRKYSVYIDQDEVKMKEINVIEKLVKIPLKERQEMRKYIIDELMPRLVYAKPTANLSKFDDAFSIAINNLLERAASRLP